MRQTLLEMTQIILSALDSDEVNSINDTVESDQVAKLIRSVYYDLATDLNLTEHQTLFQLNASGDNTKPTLMTVPDNVTRLEVLQYDCKEDGDTYPDFKEIKYKPFQDFIQDQQSLRNDTTGVGSMTVTHNGESFEILYKDTAAPTYYTTADDQQIIFDSYVETLENTLQKSKTLCMGATYPTFTMSDGFYPDLDPTQYSLLINKAKVRAFQELKQTVNPEAKEEARRQRIIVQKRQDKVKTGSELDKLPRYGR